jgi:hypothetical protein
MASRKSSRFLLRLMVSWVSWVVKWKVRNANDNMVNVKHSRRPLSTCWEVLGPLMLFDRVALMSTDTTELQRSCMATR